MFRDEHEMIGRGSAGRMSAAAAIAVFVLALASGIQTVHAQMIPSGPEPAPQAKASAKGAAAKGARKGAPPAAADADGAAKKDPAVALRSLEAGIKSYEIGKLEPAVQQLTSALAGGLPSQQMARALYYRGLAFRKQAKPAQAISDLTSAIWLKGGLADAERANAIESRAAAYREAGLGDPAPIAADASRTAAAPAATPAAAPGTGWQAATAASGATSPRLSAAAAAAQTDAPSAPPAPSAGSAGVGSFFSGLFGGSSTASSATPAPSTTASTRAGSAPVTATSSWGDATSVAGAKGRIAAPAAVAPAPAPNAKVAAAAPAAAVAPAAPAYKGKYRLQVAAVRSRAEADALAQKLKQAHGTAIGGREPAIEQSVIGAMGTFYRVRVGPYADANEPRQLCARIKPDGFDCLVVTQ